MCVDRSVLMHVWEQQRGENPNATNHVQLHIQILPVESISHKRQLPYFLQIASAQFYGFI